jgi:ATP-binding cassette subfamily B protein
MSALPTWPLSAAPTLLGALARAAGLPMRGAPPPNGPIAIEALSAMLEAAGEALDLDVEPASYRYGELPTLLQRAAPAILQGVEGQEAVLVGLLGAKGDRVCLIGPDGATRWVDLLAVKRFLVGKSEGRLGARFDATLERAQVSPRRRALLRERLLDQALGGLIFEGVWLLRLPPGAPFAAHLRAAGAGRLVAGAAVGHTISFGLGLAGLALLGEAALSGVVHPAWLLGWALGMASGLPAELWMSLSLAQLSVGVGGLIKRRLLYGALRIDPEAVRTEGIGGLVSLVIESENIEGIALNGGAVALAAAVEVGLLLLVLPSGPGGPGLALAFGAACLLALGLAWRYARRLTRWTAERQGLTGALVEQMMGHRTRVVQVAPADWHQGEEEALLGYLGRSAALDQAEALLRTGLPRLFGLLALGLLGAQFVAGGDPAALAVGAGGALLCAGALGRLTGGLGVLGQAWVSFAQIRPLWEAADRAMTPGTPGLALALPRLSAGAPLIELRGLRFRHKGRGRAVLDGASATLRMGDRVLIEGPSGGGKSTLASLIVGLRKPDSGLVLLQGLDPATLGEAGYRRRAVAAPQFHENHIILGTLAMNLLMGGRWPAGAGDVEEAEALCRELGLGPLLEKMPAGIHQVVGESGWRLSHGEQSRIFLARALLQKADVIVLDESFGALDPETLALCLRAVLDRAPTLLVIAHP